MIEIGADTLEIVNHILLVIKRSVSLIGSLIILIGALYALYQFGVQLYRSSGQQHTLNFDHIRLDLGRVIILGLEFIVASDIIETTTAPDYYSLGILASIVLIRTFLNYTLNKDIQALGQREQENG
jgi:uncharacterized membrane protein